MHTLRLSEFRAIYNQTAQLPSWLRYLLLGFLYWVEDRYITHKTDTSISQAEQEYHETAQQFDAPHWQKDAVVTITENPNSSHQLPTLTISAPYSKGFPTDEQ
jgi:hypothetical protein